MPNNAPRVTEEQVQGKIKSVFYHTPLSSIDIETAEKAGAYQSLSCLTFCTLVLENGFTVTGQSACASPENFNEVLGQQYAYANAVEKVWELEGYLLKEQLYQDQIKPVAMAEGTQNACGTNPDYIDHSAIHLLSNIIASKHINAKLRNTCEAKLENLINKAIK